MTWNEYWEQLRKVTLLLKETIDDGRYRPNAVIGLSNGEIQAIHATKQIKLPYNKDSRSS